MENKLEAQKKVLRKQKIKTYSLLPLHYFLKIFFWIGLTIFFIGLMLKFIIFKPVDNMYKGSKQKLTIQKENYKPMKKEMKLNKKELKKENDIIINEEEKEVE